MPRRPTQSIHLSDKKGRPILSVFTWADDTFQVVDERKGNRAQLIDTRSPEQQREDAMLSIYGDGPRSVEEFHAQRGQQVLETERPCLADSEDGTCSAHDDGGPECCLSRNKNDGGASQ